MFWWLLAAIVGFYVLRHLWKAYTHPAHVLGRQAANMNWVAIGRRKDETGYYDVCVSDTKGSSSLYDYPTSSYLL